MKLAYAIEQYIAQKRAGGCSFRDAERRFGTFYRRVGNLELDQVTTHHVQQYLDSAIVATATWRNNYFRLLRFFEYWILREAMPELVFPPVKRHVPQTYVPYVYTRAELRDLLRATPRCQEARGTEMCTQTFRMVILFLYGTGARMGQVLALKCSDLNLNAGTVTFPGTLLKPGRTIPLNPHLGQILQRYFLWRGRTPGECLFATREGRPLDPNTVRRRFQRLCKIANVSRRDSPAQTPRLTDLRCTFAVHRITSWIRNSADLSRMLPALAAYMGQSGLGYTEQYLLLTPERFRKQLNRLSPTHARRHWRNDYALMQFLSSL